jgi:MFS family permease
MLLLTRVRVLKRGNAQAAGFGSIGAVLANRSSLAVMLAGSTNFSVYFLFQATIGKKLLHDLYQLPSAASALFPCIMTVVSILCSLFSGVISRALGHRRKPVILFALGCMVIGGLLLTCSVYCSLGYIWVLISYCLLGFTSLSSVMNNTLMKELNPPESMGTAIGLSNGACYLVMAIYTSIAGYILDLFEDSATVVQGTVVYPREAYLSIIAFCMVMLVFAFGSACHVKETHGIPFGSSRPLRE